MKSPHHLAQQLARQWQRSDWREAHLLPGAGAWPMHLSIGAPTAHSFQHASPALREHLQVWQAVSDHGPGSVQWAPRSYRGGAAPLPVPLHWTLERPSDAMAAIVRFAGREHASVAADHQALVAVLAVSARSPSVSRVEPSAAALRSLIATVASTPLVRFR